MTWHFDFWNHRDLVFSSIVDDFAHIVLGEVATIGIRSANVAVLAVFAIVPPLTPVALGAIGGLLGEFRMALHLKSPASCIGEVEMQTVELVMSHGIDLLHHKLLAEEMTAEVEHEATVLESGSVGNLDRWQSDSRLILHIAWSRSYRLA